MASPEREYFETVLKVKINRLMFKGVEVQSLNFVWPESSLALGKLKSCVASLFEFLRTLLEMRQLHEKLLYSTSHCPLPVVAPQSIPRRLLQILQSACLTS